MKAVRGAGEAEADPVEVPRGICASVVAGGRALRRYTVGPSSHPLDEQPTGLIGRANELEAIIRRLTVEGVRLLTLTGPAGVGKTRLALAAAATDQVVRHFPDGVHMVDLAPIQDPAQVLPAIALTLGLADTGPLPLLDRL